MKKGVSLNISQGACVAGLKHVAMLLLTGVLLTACGGGGDSGSGSNSSTPVPSPGSPANENPLGTNPGDNNPVLPPADDTVSGTTALSLCGYDTTVQQLVDKINAVRSQGRMCGQTFYPAVGALTWNTRLANAAQAHSTDMATNNYFAHEGLNGSTVGTRASAAGYNFRIVGENIAAGYNGIDVVMTAWINSPGHCANIMNASFKEYGMACTVGNQSTTYPNYWTQEFGATR